MVVDHNDVGRGEPTDTDGPQHMRRVVVNGLWRC